MVIYFLRHAEAEADADTDFDRKLTEKGQEQAEKAGAFLLKNELKPDVILTSPVVRARQTAKAVAKKLGMEFEEAQWLSCGMAAQTCLKELRACDKKAAVLLVGHEPDFSEVIAALIGAGEADALKIRKTSLTAIELRTYKCGAGQLQFLVPVRLM